MRKLSVVLITMNRKVQLTEAVRSVLCCTLPADTEFVIIDNGSTDNSQESITALIESDGRYALNYYYSEVNLGVGGGRSLGLEKSTGEIVYFLDDDSVINEKSYADFFPRALGVFDHYPEVSTLTTRCYDEMLGEYRFLRKSKKQYNDFISIYVFSGNTHFLRKSAMKTPLYFDIKYGFEEIYPALTVIDRGGINALVEDVETIHKPLFNKWHDKDSLEGLLISGNASLYAQRCVLYPMVFRPFLYAAFLTRCYKRQPVEGLDRARIRRESMALAKKIRHASHADKIRFGTVIRVLREFGSGAAF